MKTINVQRAFGIGTILILFLTLCLGAGLVHAGSPQTDEHGCNLQNETWDGTSCVKTNGGGQPTVAPTEVGTSSGDTHGQPGDPGNNNASCKSQGEPDKVCTPTPAPTQIPPTVIQPSNTPVDTNTPISTATIAPSDTPVPTGTTASTATLEPTATIAPSDTPIPTGTTAPTATLEPTATATPTCPWLLSELGFCEEPSPTATATIAPSDTPTATATLESTATALLPSPTATVVILPSPTAAINNGHQPKRPTVSCPLAGEFIFAKNGNTVYWHKMNGSAEVSHGQYTIDLKGSSPNERIAVIGCRLYFSWTVTGDTQSDLYFLSLFGGSPVRITTTADVSEMDPVISTDGGYLAFTAFHGKDKVNVETSSLSGGARAVYAENAFAPAYDRYNVLSYSLIDGTIVNVSGVSGTWHTFSPDNTPIGQVKSAFNNPTGLFGDPLGSVSYRPLGHYAVQTTSTGTIEIISVDEHWLPAGTPTAIEGSTSSFAIWVYLR